MPETEFGTGSMKYLPKILTNEEVSCFKSLICCFYHANKCSNDNKCWHFNIYEQDKFRAQLKGKKVL